MTYNIFSKKLFKEVHPKDRSRKRLEILIIIQKKNKS